MALDFEDAAEEEENLDQHVPQLISQRFSSAAITLLTEKWKVPCSFLSSEVIEYCGLCWWLAAVNYDELLVGLPHALALCSDSGECHWWRLVQVVWHSLVNALGRSAMVWFKVKGIRVA